MRIGLVSDTHGLLRPQLLDFLRGADAIVHGGDVGDPGILDALRALAPLAAVRGNNDRGTWAQALPETEWVQLGSLWLLAIHDRAALDVDPAGAGVRIVVSGHSHRPAVDERDGVLWINPGSAGPRRFKLPVTAAELRIDGDAVAARIVELV